MHLPWFRDQAGQSGVDGPGVLAVQGTDQGDHQSQLGHLISLGIRPEEVMKASRCRRGYWWMSGNGIVQRASNDAWLGEQGVLDLKAQWIALH